MKRTLFFLFILFNLTVYAQFKHPVMLHTAQNLALVKSRVQSGEEHRSSAFLEMKKSNYVDASNDVKKSAYSKLIYPGKDGKLVYQPYTDKGDILPDFSNCGYMGGGVELPVLPVKITLKPGDFSKDDAPRIQQAIEKLSKEKPDKTGFRGAVLLKKGKYNIQQTINIGHSGIVLRGEGDEENGTLLIATKPEKYNLIRISSYSEPEILESSKQKITNQYVPSGSNKITVKDASKFKLGDAVIVERPSTKEWISYIGMDKIAPKWNRMSSLSEKEQEKARKEGRVSPDGKKHNITKQWEPGSKDLYFERVITGINGNEIILNVPLTNAFQEEFGGGWVYKYTIKDRVSQVGVENLRGISEFNKKVVKKDNYIGDYYADENHSILFIFVGISENIWLRNLTCMHFSGGYSLKPWSRYVTVQDCRYLDPVAVIAGGRRTAYGISGGQMCLIQRCYSSYCRHDMALGEAVAGPNAYVDNHGEMVLNTSEPHQRWSAGCLFDNCSLKGPVAYFNAVNRGNYGTGHGWAGAQMLFWNCKAPLTLLMTPPTAQNFSIGNYGTISTEEDKWATPEEIQIRIDKMNIVSETNFKYTGSPVVGDAYIESPDKYVKPQFLYYKQLWDRLGKDAVKLVTTKEQQKIIFKD